MKIKPTQKNTPEGWNLIPAGEIFNFVRTYAFSRDNLINGTGNSHGIGNIHYGDIHSTYASSSIDLEKVSVPMIKDADFVPNEKDLLKDGDLVMADASEDYAGVGVTVSLHGIGDKKVIGGLHTFVLRDTKGKTDKRFRQYIFRNPEIRNSLQKVANGVSVYGVSKTAVSKILLPLPSLHEQNRIVAVLETWDQAIQKLTQKIEKKKSLKKGLMQELLTGKKRLLGFSEKWSSKKLSDLGVFSKGMGILKDEVTKDGFNAVRYGELYTRYNFEITKICSKIPSSVTSSTRKIKYGDILFAGSGETVDEIGKCAVYLLKEDGYAGGDIIIFTPKKADSLFLSYFLNTGVARKKLRELGQGQSVVHIYKSDIEDLEFELPPQEEQVAIANTLAVARKEIQTLEHKLKVLQEQKRYLLNNLITGTIRTPKT